MSFVSRWFPISSALVIGFLFVVLVINLVAPPLIDGAVLAADVSAPVPTHLTVNSNAEDSDGACADSPGDCTLREAILAANAGSGSYIIGFNLAPGFRTIVLAAALPSLLGGNTTIDGYTQEDSSPATDSVPADVLINIDASAINFNAFNITSDNNVIKGLVIKNTGGIAIEDWWAGISIVGASAHHNLVAGNYIGVTEFGSSAAPNAFGVLILDGAHDNTIGGSTAADRNIISGNLINGVSIGTISSGIPATNTISGNYIGTNEAGLNVIPNGGAGVYLGPGSQHNIVGGHTAGERNVISANGFDGVYISGINALYNTISGNYIGPDKDGDFLGGSLQDYGVRIDGKAKYNLVGGPSSAYRNLISQNNRDGIRIAGSETMSNTVSNNWIGFRADGVTGLSNEFGVTITNSASYNRVAIGNVIGGNESHGVRIYGSGTMSNTVAGNIIGIRPDETGPLANFGAGIIIQAGASRNIVGGTSPEDRNILSFNHLDGVLIQDDDSRFNRVIGNYIGTDSTGTVDLGNSHNGVHITEGARHNTIGGDLPGEGNLISGNDDGILIDSGASLTSTTSNRILGNLIGVDASVAITLPNSIGIHISGKSLSNVIGGDLPSSSNLISGNAFQGVLIEGEDAVQNSLYVNVIGSDWSGTKNLGNGNEGVLISLGPKRSVIGPSNRIAFNGYKNGHYGIAVFGANTDDNTITENSIYANLLGGIDLSLGANQDIQPPVILSALPGSVVVTGTACVDCSVELFSSPNDEGQGKTYLKTSDSDLTGVFTITLPFLPEPFLTATATDDDGNTSRFSAVFETSFNILLLPLILLP